MSQENIMRQRADNYAHHFECRQTVKAFPADFRDTIIHAAGHLRAPELSLVGSTVRTDDDDMAIIILANRIGLNDPFLLNPWYTSEQGWASFQEAWNNLPEPVDFTNRKLSTGAVDKS